MIIPCKAFCQDHCQACVIHVLRGSASFQEKVKKMSELKEGHGCFRFGVEILSRYGRVGECPLAGKSKPDTNVLGITLLKSTKLI